MTKNYFVYIMASQRNGTLYIGVTNDIIRRVYEHKNNLIKGFTEEYKVHHLVYVEETDDIGAAITREKQLKKPAPVKAGVEKKLEACIDRVNES